MYFSKFHGYLENFLTTLFSTTPTKKQKGRELSFGPGDVENLILPPKALRGLEWSAWVSRAERFPGFGGQTMGTPVPA